MELYNNVISTDYSVDDYISTYPFLATMPANYYIYNMVTQFILKCAKKHIPIQFIEDHDEVYLNTVKELPTNTAIKIYNIDHHHDISYNDDDFAPGAMENLEIGVGNWVLALWRDFNVQSYTWIHNYTCHDINTECEEKLKYLTEHYAIADFNLDTIVPDKLYICKSRQWVPSLYNGLFELWENMVAQFS